MKVTFEINAERKYVSHCIEILEEESVVLEELERIIVEHADCRRDADELGSWEYRYLIGDQKRVFPEDLSAVIGALLERFEDRIKEVSSGYATYAYQFQGLKSLGNSYFSSDFVDFYERRVYSDGEEDWKYINQIQNCRFYDLFANPLYCTAIILEGTVWLDDDPASEKLTWFANPIPEAYQSELSDGRPKARYTGTVQLFDCFRNRIGTIKGKFALLNLTNFLEYTEEVQLNPILESMYLLNFFLVDLLELEHLGYQGTAFQSKVYDLTYLTFDLKKVWFAFDLNSFQEKMTLEQSTNVFLKYRNKEGNFLDHLITYVTDKFGKENIFRWYFYPQQDGNDILTCEFEGNCKLRFRLDRENEDSVRGVDLILDLWEEETQYPRVIDIELPYVYGYKGNFIQEDPIRIRAYAGTEEPEGEPEADIAVEEMLALVRGYMEEREYSLAALVSLICKEGPVASEELYDFLLTVVREAPERAERAKQENPNLQEKVQEILGKDKNYFPDPDALRSICLELADYLCWKYRKEDGERRERPTLPNLVFLGGPGSGKTSMIRRLARDVLGAKFYETTPSELKGMYVGHTRGVFLDKIDQLQKQEDFGRDAPAILFLDEAYTLFETNGQNKESFTKDIIALLLAIMQRGEKKFSYQIEEGDGARNTVNKTITVKANTVIWMAGYEKEMRKALSSNPGIFRRVTSIFLPDPTMEDLWRCFQTATKEMEREDQLLVEEIKDEILDFFRWGVTKEHAEFFGNYAGAKKLAANMLNTLLLLGKDAPRQKREKELLLVIDAQKKEIRRQYKIVISEDKRLPFEVISDLSENLDDYIGNDSVREQMREIVTMMVDAEIYKKRHIDIPKGALLMGYPGTGKTYLAKCMAGELVRELKNRGSNKKIAFIPVAATELKNEELILALFSTAEEYEAAILFIDELDAIGRNRYQLSDPGPLIQLMKEMDGFDTRKTIFVLAATNAPETLDPALKRSGRFDLQFEIRKPNRKDRKELLRYHIRRIMPEVTEEILDHAAGYAYEMAPADIKEAVNEAALLYYRCENKIADGGDEEALFLHRAVRAGEHYEGARVVKIGAREYWTADAEDGIRPELFLCDLKEVLEKKRNGERLEEGAFAESFQTQENRGRSAVAIHEVGHALVSAGLGYRIERITVLGRGMTRGYVKSQADHIETRSGCLGQIRLELGGRVAEELFFGENISIGACADISAATELARSMVEQYGMGDTVGVMTLQEEDRNYLKKSVKYTCSEAYREKADREVQKILEEQLAAVREYLGGCKDELGRLAEFVFEQEEITGEVFLEKCRELGVKIRLD